MSVSNNVHLSVETEIIEEIVSLFENLNSEVNVTPSAIVGNHYYFGEFIFETASIDGQDKMRMFLGDDEPFATYSNGAELNDTLDYMFDKKREFETMESLDLDAEEYHIENDRLIEEGAKLDAKLTAQGIDVDNLTLDEQFEYGYFDL